MSIYAHVRFGVAGLSLFTMLTAASAADKKPKDIDKLDQDGFSKLHRAAIGGNLDDVKRLVKAGADVDVQQKNYKGRPLQYAAARGHEEVVKFLVNNGATVDSADKFGRTPLMWAAMKGKKIEINLLLDAGAEVGLGTNSGWTALHYSMKNRHEGASKLLIKRGAPEDAKNSQGKTPEEVKPEG